MSICFDSKALKEQKAPQNFRLIFDALILPFPLNIAFTYRFLLCYTFLCCCLGSYAQNYPLERFTIWDGLPQMQVNCVVEDHKGYIWAGTKRGLSRYDGTRFIPVGKESGLQSKRILDIELSPDGSVWILWEEGISRFHKGIYTNYPLKRKQFIALLFDESNAPLLLPDRSKNAYRFSYEAPHVEELLNLFPGEINGKTARFDSQSKEVLVISEAMNEVFGINAAKGKWRALLSSGDLKAFNDHTKYQSILINEQGETFISSQDQLYFFDQGSLRSINKYKEQLSSTRLYELPSGAPLIINKKQDLLEVQGETLKVYPYENQSKVNDALTDRFGYLWLATENGLVKMLGGAFRHLDKETGAENYIWSLVEGGENQVFLCSYGSGLFSYDLTTGKSKQLSTSEPVLKEIRDFYNGACRTKDGRVFIPHSEGLIKWEAGRFEAVAGLENTAVFFCYYDELEELLFLGVKGGFKIMDKQGELRYFGNAIEWSSENPEWDPISFIISIQKDAEGYYWIGSWHQLARFDLRNSSIKTYSKQNGDINFDGTVSLHLDETNRLWLGTTNGLYHYEPADDSFHLVPINVEDKTISALIESDGKLFLGMAKGLGVLDLITYNEGKDVDFRFYDKSWGFTGIDCQQNAMLKHSDGRIWVATSDKVCIIDPDKLEQKEEAPIINFEALTLGDSLIYLRDSTEESNLEFAAFGSSMKIDFGAFSHHNPAGTMFRSRLRRHSTEFSSPSKERSVTYSGLNPGKYVFELIAINPVTGQESEIRKLKLELRARWQDNTHYRILAGILLGIFAGALGIYYRDRRMLRYLRRKKEKLDLETQAQKSRSKALFAQMNPHFVNNALSAIHSFILKNDRDQADTYLVKFADLMRLVLMESSQEEIELREEIELITKYVEMEHLRFADKFNYEISVDSQLDGNRKIPAMMIQPLVENAINHGLKYQNKMGSLQISFKKELDGIRCCVSDNGVGRKKAHTIKAQTNNRYKSISGKILQERIDILKKQGEVIELIFNDKDFQRDGETGTDVTITFKS